uniref:Non-homologous end-joining factor 1 n=1 Tax=Salvator merianae TaxID=96440 RepID=A0A8D0DM93_SALMN
MESTEDPGNVLLLQPWASVCFAESSKLMAKAWFGDTGYALLLSDLSSLWYERADSELIQQRSKELNKRLTGHASSFLNHLRDLMCPLLEGQQDSSTSFSCQLSPSMLILHVKSELLGLPFYWDFRCSAAPVEMMSRHLVRPLMSMSLLLQGQVQKLATLLLQKDAEIEDYRESGAALSRERLQTEPFKEESFLQTFEDETLPQACCLEDGICFTPNLKRLYMAVTQQQARKPCKRHREASGDSGSPENAIAKDLIPEAINEPTEEEAGKRQAAAEQSVQESMVPSSQSQKARLPVAKSKGKKAKGLFS